MWGKYQNAVLWAYPHHMEELQEYHDHIISHFNCYPEATLTIEFDQAAHKFFHGNTHLSFADIHKLNPLFLEIFLSRGARSDSNRGNVSGEQGSSTGRGRQDSQRLYSRQRQKCNRSPNNFPICHEFNKAEGCCQAECQFIHKCSSCFSSSHTEVQCPKMKERK